MKKSVIVFYDSGVGGLTTLSLVRKFFPNENFLYFADDVNCPYGNRTKAEINYFVKNNIDFILSKFEIKLFVFACNTATACCVENVRKNYLFNVVGIEPAIKPAIKNSRNKKILALMTKLTASQEKYKKLIEENKDVVYTLGLSNLANDIDNLLMGDRELSEISLKEIEDVLTKNNEIGAIVLGCTHYVYLKERIEKEFKIKTFDGNDGVRKRVEFLLKKNKLFNNKDFKGELIIMLSSFDKNKQKQYKKIYNNIKIY